MKSFNTSKFIKNFGFTVLEIVIAISVIGILAVIVAVSYFGITNRATESTIKSDLSNALGDFNLYKTEKNKYPTAVDDCPNVDTNKICIEFSGDNQYEYLVDSATNPTSYRLIVTNKDLAYYIEDDFNSPKLLDASAPEFNPAPITAPTTPTVAVTLSSPDVLATASAVTCSAGTAQYGLRSRTNDGTWSAYSAWSTTRTASQTANDGVKYGYQAQSRCYVDNTKISSIVTSAEATYIDPVATPGAVTVSSNTPAPHYTTWSWSPATCPAGSSTQYRYVFSNSTGYTGGELFSANTSADFTTSTEGVTYTLTVSARCYSTVTTSGWSAPGSASYYRPISSPVVVTGGNATIDGAYTVRTFNSSGTLSITNGTLTGVSVLIVGGGGSGAKANTVTGVGGSGGKGGQVISLSNQSLTGNINVTVGSSNQKSSLGASTATGGGGAAGGTATTCGSQGVDGANGVQSSISGTSRYYGSGGGGGVARGCSEYDYGGGSISGSGAGSGASWYYDVCAGVYIDYPAQSGVANRGGGGGGGGFYYDSTTMVSAAGGSGVVIIRYLTP